MAGCGLSTPTPGAWPLGLWGHGLGLGGGGRLVGSKISGTRLAPGLSAPLGRTLVPSLPFPSRWALDCGLQGGTVTVALLAVGGAAEHQGQELPRPAGRTSPSLPQDIITLQVITSWLPACAAWQSPSQPWVTGPCTGHRRSLGLRFPDSSLPPERPSRRLPCFKPGGLGSPGPGRA